VRDVYLHRIAEGVTRRLRLVETIVNVAAAASSLSLAEVG
jgi:hypothetical protein